MPARAQELNVVVTLKPVHSIVAGMMMGVGKPTLLLKGAASPHAYALKPSDMRDLQSADLIVRDSPGLEVFLDKALSQVNARTTILTITDIPGMGLLKLRVGGAFEAHEDDHATHGHDHGPGDGAGIDPHLWLDPVNAAAIANKVADVLGGLRPGHRDLFRQNAGKVVARLAALQDEVVKEIAPVKGRPFLVFHDAYQYFEHRFGLNVVGAVTVSPDVPPSAHRLRMLREKLKATGAACVFAEPQFPPRIIASIIEGTGVRQGTLDPLGAALEAGPDQYFMLLKSVARSLRTCLAGPS